MPTLLVSFEDCRLKRPTKWFLSDFTFQIPNGSEEFYKVKSYTDAMENTRKSKFLWLMKELWIVTTVQNLDPTTSVQLISDWLFRFLSKCSEYLSEN